MLVPARVEQLHVARPALEEPPCHQAVVGEAALAADVRTVERQDVLRLVRQVGELGHRGLHAIGQLVLGDAGADLRVPDLLGPALVQGREVVEHAAAQVARQAVGIPQVEHRVPLPAELHALVLARQEAAAPVPVVEDLPAGRALVARGHGHEGGQVLAHAAEAVGEPGADARPAGTLGAREEVGDRGRVVHLGRVHRLHEAQVVDHLGRARQEARDRRAALPVLREVGQVAEQRLLALPVEHRAEADASDEAVGDLLAVLRAQARLVVEEVDVRRPAVLEQVHHPLRLGRAVHAAAGPLQDPHLGTLEVPREERAQGQGAHTAGRTRQERAPRGHGACIAEGRGFGGGLHREGRIQVRGA